MAPAGFQERNSRSTKQSVSGGGKTGRGESLIQLHRREYLPIIENELKVVGVRGGGRKALLERKKEKKIKLSLVGLICP